ncbi:MAG: ATP-binding cassette domain-containing protein [Promethearchaeota archaeon]
MITGKNHTKAEIFSMNNVSFQIADKILLKDITVRISSSDITGIIGPSGAGKSTFLRLLNKLLSPSKGIILYNHQNMNDLPSRQIRKEVGLVQQRPYLFPGSVRDNLLYGPEIWNIKYSDKELITLLEKVALEQKFLDRDVDGLSGGEQQRVSLARSLANNPKVLLLDEPTSSLDINSEEIIEKTLKRLAYDGIKVIIVTHSLEQTKRLTDIIIFMRDGELKEKMTTNDFFSLYNEEEIRSFFKKELEED